MKRTAALFALLTMLALGAWLWHRARNTPSGSATREISDQTAAAATSTVTTVPVLSPPTSSPSTPLVGETILRDFANPNLPPENDLTLISRLMDNFTLLVKSARDHPLSANEDWAAMLRGLNPGHERFLPDHHVALNAQGQLVDRWGTPLFFHALGGQHFEIRSAGPDKKLWTEDDVHRNADGSFLRGAQLNPPSLLDSTRSPAR